MKAFNAVTLYDPSEHKLQSKLVDILPGLMKPGVVCMAIANGSLRHPRVAIKLKDEGVLPGAPDLVFVMKGGRVAWLEMKKGKGRSSDVQLGFHARLKRLGHSIGVAHSIEEALDYLKKTGVLR